MNRMIQSIVMLRTVSLCLVVLLFALEACDDQNVSEPNMPDQPEQTVSALDEDDEARLREQRAVVESHLVESEENRRKYKTAVGKLGIVRAILQSNVYKPHQTYELQCLGIVLGDAFVQEIGMEWVMVEDEYGRDPAIRLAGTSVILFPLTMISKRIERGEEVDVFDLFNGIAAKVEELKADGV